MLPHPPQYQLPVKLSLILRNSLIKENDQNEQWEKVQNFFIELPKNLNKMKLIKKIITKYLAKYELNKKSNQKQKMN